MINGKPALLLSDVGGVPLSHHSVLTRVENDVKTMLETAYRAFFAKGFACADLRLGNFHLVGDKVFVLDLEQVDTLTYEDEERFQIDIRELMGLWRYDLKFKLCNPYEKYQDK